MEYQVLPANTTNIHLLPRF